MNMRIKAAAPKRKAVNKPKKGRYRLIAFAVLVPVLSAVILALTELAVDRDDDIKRVYTDQTDYSMNLQHYAGFDHSDTHIGVYPDWRETGVLLRDNPELTISAKVKPVNLHDIQLRWYSTDENIAQVDSSGNITVTAPGVVDICAEIRRGKTVKTSRSKLTVIQPVTGIFMPTTSVTLYMGSTGRLLEANVFPSDCTNPNVIWSSKDSKVASVDEKGHVRPTGVGMTEITASTEEGGFTSRCFVSVVNYSVKPDSVTIMNDYKDDAYLKVGESFNIVTSVLPSNSKDKTLQWVSTDPNVASVTQTGKVRALGEGETFITVATANGKHDTLKLTVQPDENDMLTETDEDEIGIQETGLAPEYASDLPITNGQVTYSTYPMTLQWMVRLQMGLQPPPKRNGGASYASESEVAEFMNPASYIDGAYKYQFLDLSYANGISEEVLNEFLANKGVLRNHAADFIAAAHEYHVSEIYLVAHACLETGNGTSTLSRGVEVNGTTVYNMYGIGAYDSSAVYSGSKRAYELGWTSVSAAIYGGAQWISEHYVNALDSRQNTLYKMLWNPGAPGTHQYATDIEWATSQAINIEKIFRSFPEAVKSYDVPVYSGMSAPVIEE